MPPPTVPTSSPPKRIEACSPPVDAAAGAVRHRARPDHAEILAGRGEDRGDRRRRRERDGLHAARDRAVRAGPGERLEILGGRAEHAADLLVGEECLGEHGLAVPRPEVLVRRLLVAAHVRLEDRALGLHRRALHHVAHVQRVGVPRHHVRADRVAGRPAPEHVAHRPDDVRLRPRAGARVARATGRRTTRATRACRSVSPWSQRASATASRRVGADEARRARDPVGEHERANGAGGERAARHRGGEPAFRVRERDVDGLGGAVDLAQRPRRASSSYAPSSIESGHRGDGDHGDADERLGGAPRTARGRPT